MSQQENDNKGEPVIRVLNLVKRFPGKTVLKGVTLDIYPGETMVIMGGSGCGKTTLLKHMIALHWPDEGHVELFGQNLSEADERELDEIRKRFGMVFQYGAMFNSMTVGQNVALPLQEHSNLDPDTIDIMVRIKLELVQLREWVDEMRFSINR